MQQPQILSAVPVATIEVLDVDEHCVVALTSDLPADLRWSERMQIAEERDRKASRIAVASVNIGPIEV